jgi:hypothetical protein
LRGVLRSKVA